MLPFTAMMTLIGQSLLSVGLVNGQSGEFWEGENILVDDKEWWTNLEYSCDHQIYDNVEELGGTWPINKSINQSMEENTTVPTLYTRNSQRPKKYEM